MISYLLIIGLVAAQEKCSFIDKSITEPKKQKLVELHNEIRNNVALAKIPNSDKVSQTAKNMNYLMYDEKYAEMAQSCAETCPKTILSCHRIASNLGVLMYEEDAWSGGADWFPDQVVKSWLKKNENARQLLWGMSTKFGCGRVLSNDKSIRKDVVVCVYDKKALSNGTPYQYGNAASSCIYGRKSGYLGLCSPDGKNLIHKTLTGHKGHKKIHQKKHKKSHKHGKKHQKQHHF